MSLLGLFSIDFDAYCSVVQKFFIQCVLLPGFNVSSVTLRDCTFVITSCFVEVYKKIIMRTRSQWVLLHAYVCHYRVFGYSLA